MGRDPERNPQWNTTAVAVKDVTGQLDVVGTRFTLKSLIVGRPLDVTWQIQEVQAPRHIMATATSPMGAAIARRPGERRSGRRVDAVVTARRCHGSWSGRPSAMVGRGSFVYFRIYRQELPAFDGWWQLPDFRRNG